MKYVSFTMCNREGEVNKVYKTTGQNIKKKKKKVQRTQRDSPLKGQQKQKKIRKKKSTEVE